MKSTNSSINGLFVYHDNKDNAIYHDLFSNRDYAIPHETYDKYTFYSLRAVIAIALIFLMKDILKFELSNAVLIGICIYLILSLLFRYNYLWKFKESLYFYNHKRDNAVVKTAKEYTAGRLFLLVLIATIILASLIFQGLQSHYAGKDLIAFYALTAIAVLFIAFYLIVLIVKLIKKL